MHLLRPFLHLKHLSRICCLIFVRALQVQGIQQLCSPGYGVVQHCSGVVTMKYCTIASNAGALSNGNMTIEHCTFTGANVYASSIAAGLAPTITVRGSHAAAANAGNHTETIVAAIS